MHSRREDVLSLLLAARTEEGEPLTDTEVRDELMTLLVAGHETTATALAWTAERLTRRPGGWDALRAGGEEYAEAAGKEALRAQARRSPSCCATCRPTRRRRARPPRGHRGRAVHLPRAPAPRRLSRPAPPFRPERFLGPEPQGGTYTWIPFGGGVRRCLGAAFALMELRIVLNELAAVEAVAPAPAPEPTRRRAITMVPGRGAEVVFELALAASMPAANGDTPRELFLIDGNSLAYRAFFALPESIATSDGRPTNAIFGFASMLVKILTDHGDVPTVVVWDAGMSGRKEISADYKAQRSSRPTCWRSSGPTCARSSRRSATPTSPSRASRPTTSSPRSPTGEGRRASP